MYDKHSKEVSSVITNYFNGIYNGDVSLLVEAFHPQALLFGDINGTPYFKSATDYIEGVKSRKSPQELGESFKMKIISIEIVSDNAIVKAHLPMLGYNYYDYLSLAKINNNWKIVNKLFTHVE